MAFAECAKRQKNFHYERRFRLCLHDSCLILFRFLLSTGPKPPDAGSGFSLWSTCKTRIKEIDIAQLRNLHLRCEVRARRHPRANEWTSEHMRVQYTSAREFSSGTLSPNSPKGNDDVLYCLGDFSALAAESIARMGYSNVYRWREGCVPTRRVIFDRKVAGYHASLGGDSQNRSALHKGHQSGRGSIESLTESLFIRSLSTDYHGKMTINAVAIPSLHSSISIRMYKNSDRDTSRQNMILMQIRASLGASTATIELRSNTLFLQQHPDKEMSASPRKTSH